MQGGCGNRSVSFLCVGEGGKERKRGRRRSNRDGEQVTQAYNSLFISHLAKMRSSGIDKLSEAPSIKWR